MGEMGLRTLLLCQFQRLLDQQQVYKNSWGLFGTLMVFLFIKGDIKGLLNEFYMPKNNNTHVDRFKYTWRFPNRLFGMVYR